MVNLLRRGSGIIAACCLLASLWHCTGDPAPAAATPAREVPSVQRNKIIERAIAAHGMESMDEVTITFDFRNRLYGIKTNMGEYRYSRAFIDSTGRAVTDELTNDGLQRLVEGEAEQLSAKDSTAVAGSVNSVRYFFMLPYVLDDPAVMVEAMDTVMIDGGTYEQLEVRFSAAGGGEDFEDVYRYFFNADNGELDYLAYSFDVNEGGIRFRKAINQRRVGGILVQDYENYGIDGDDRDLSDIAGRYSRGALPLLSLIENTEVTVVQGGRK